MEIMTLPLITAIKTEDQARQLAIDFQNYAGDEQLSYGDLVEYQRYFQELADRFELVDEFKENGII